MAPAATARRRPCRVERLRRATVSGEEAPGQSGDSPQEPAAVHDAPADPPRPLHVAPLSSQRTNGPSPRSPGLEQAPFAADPAAPQQVVGQATQRGSQKDSFPEPSHRCPTFPRNPVLLLSPAWRQAARHPEAGQGFLQPPRRFLPGQPALTQPGRVEVDRAFQPAHRPSHLVQPVQAHGAPPVHRQQKQAQGTAHRERHPDDPAPREAVSPPAVTHRSHRPRP